MHAYTVSFVSKSAKRRGTAGHVAFFGFISEMKTPHDYPKTMYLLQSIDTTMYLVAAVVIYRYCGPDVASPALGSAGHVMSKVAYGIALPTVSDVARKFLHVRVD